MNDATQWLMYELILLNLMAFFCGALFGVNFERLMNYKDKDITKESLENEDKD